MQSLEMLFVYGTLSDPSVQRNIFGTEIQGRKATLSNWARFKGDNGYLFIKPVTGGAVPGKILSLTEKQLQAADQWEELPLYIREWVSVTMDDGSEQEAWVYTRREAQGEPFSFVGMEIQ